MPGTTQAVKLPDLPHLKGCPKNRIEAFTHDAPRQRVDDSGTERMAGYRVVSIVRCGDCGVQEVLDDQGKLVNDYRRSLTNGTA